MEIDYNKLGNRIKEARLAANMTQEALAEAVDLSITHISNVENGHAKISLPALFDIAILFSTSIDALLCDSLSYNAEIHYLKEASDCLSDCTANELKVLIDVLKTTKASIREYLNYEKHP